jgi:hypothetical protein
MARNYTLVQLQGGPLDGTLAQAPLRADGSTVPVDIIGLPVPVLDERTEKFSWDTANYFPASPSRASTRQRTSRTSFLIAQPVVASIQRLTARAANTIVRRASIESRWWW